MSETKLKPCPFCGAKPLLCVRTIRGLTQDMIKVYVRCQDCDIEKSATVSSGIVFEKVIAAKERVVEAWNRRENELGKN